MLPLNPPCCHSSLLIALYAPNTAKTHSLGEWGRKEGRRWERRNMPAADPTDGQPPGEGATASSGGGSGGTR